jgi:hypothetical protein
MRTTLWLGLVVTLAALVAGACNNVGDCPSASAITPGGSCSGDNLECPYTLQSPSMACDGTSIDGGIATSCVCSGGSWTCPSPYSCSSDAGEDVEASDAVPGAAEASTDAAEQ